MALSATSVNLRKPEKTGMLLDMMRLGVWGSVVCGLVLMGACGASRLPPEVPPVAPTPIVPAPETDDSVEDGLEDGFTPAPDCQAEGDQVVCGGGLCEPLGDGTYACEGDRTCRFGEAGGGNPPIFCQDDGGTREREKEEVEEESDEADPNESIDGSKGPCSVSMIAHFKAYTGASAPVDYDPNEVGQANLAQTQTVYLPYGHKISFDVKPNPDRIAPWGGTFSFGLEQSEPNQDELKEALPTDGERPRAHVSKDQAEQLAERWTNTWSKQKKKYPKVKLGRRRALLKVKLTAYWDPDDESVAPCEASREFTIIHPDPPKGPTKRLNLGGEVGKAKATINESKRPDATRQRKTRVFPEDNPRPIYRHQGYYVTPVVTFWSVPGPLNACCEKRDRKYRVIQFARAYTEGEFSKQGKDWKLDASQAEKQKAENGADHDPAFPDTPQTSSAGGTQELPGKGLLQIDAPGIPPALYDKLASSENQSTFVQQFVALLVCAHAQATTDVHHLQTSEVKSAAVVTIRWTFPGKGAAPIVTLKADDLAVDCAPLATILECNELKDSYEKPKLTDSQIPRLKTKPHAALKTDVERWAQKPAESFETKCD